MHSLVLLLAAGVSWFAEGQFLGRVVDEWVLDTQEFIRAKLPHLLVVALISLVLQGNLLEKVIAFSFNRRGEEAEGRGGRHNGLFYRSYSSSALQKKL